MKRRTVLAGGIGLGATAALPGGMALAQAKEVIIATTAGLMERALQDHVKASLAPYKYPRWIEFRTDLPKTATGKIQRFKLRAEAPSR